MKKLNKIMIGASLLLMTASTQAWADIVVIVSAERTAPPLSLQQITRIFEGKSNLMIPVDIARPSSTRRDFYAKIVGMDEAQAIARWSKLIFTGKVAAPKQYASAAQVVEAVAADPNVIGYVDSSFVNMTVKVIFTVK